MNFNLNVIGHSIFNLVPQINIANIERTFPFFESFDSGSQLLFLNLCGENEEITKQKGIKTVKQTELMKLILKQLERVKWGSDSSMCQVR